MRQIIFDLDETIYIEKELRIKREQAILEFLGERKEEYNKLKENHGTIESLKLLNIKREKFFDLINKVPILLEKDLKLIDLIEKLKSKYKIIILSNSPNYCVYQTLEKLGILNLVDKYYSGESFKNPKPAKECFFMVQEGDICVGNNFKKDLQIPKQLGAITVLLGDFKDEADFSIHDIYELKELLDII